MQDYIKKLQEAYYAGTPEVSNEEYDSLVERFGEDGLGTGGEFKHMYRMYSLQKVYPSRGDEPTIKGSGIVRTPKLDGAACSLLYINGDRVQGNTRGDGFTSPTTFEDWKLDLLNVPRNLDGGVVQVTGEIVTTKEVSNERNYASGALQLKSEDEFLQRVCGGGLIFIAYSVQDSEDSVGLGATYTSDMQYLASKDFNTVIDSDWSNCPQDGIVYRYDDNDAFYQAGFTDKFPRGAYAEKEDEEGVWTTLTDIIWDTGKSGKVTPKAIFDPVVIDDATITRATLNNAGYLEALGCEIGCEVCIVRSGKIIPKIVDVR